MHDEQWKSFINAIKKPKNPNNFKGEKMSYIMEYLRDAKTTLEQLDPAPIEKMIQILIDVRSKNGRLFILGVGGSAGNASHAVNDFRKLVGIETYTATDNVSELTARTNDEGWHTVFSEWLKTSHIDGDDAVMILSVGGGNKEKNISVNLVEAMDVAKANGAKIIGIVGRDGGYTKTIGDAVVVVPIVNPDRITPHAESFQAVVWHLIASDPRLMIMANKWESSTKK
jgi:D-sedoheptulose 7-phosphate isomerase